MASVAQAVHQSIYGSFDNQSDFHNFFDHPGAKNAANSDVWELPYTPRPEMEAFPSRHERNAFLICHRRYGKTVACIAELVLRATLTKKKNAQFVYVCPFRSQAKAVAWQYLVSMTLGLATDIKVSELAVTLPNGAKIWLSGSDNVNALRGLYLDGCVLDEFAQCRPDLLEAVILPCLLDRNGWLVIIGTAYGRLNQFFAKYEEAKDSDDWFFADLKVHDTNVIPADEIARIKRSISDAKFNQEFQNDFSAELVGTYYASQINQLEQEGKINSDVHWDHNRKVHVAFDIGRGDNTVAWFWQETPFGINFIDFYTNNGEQAKHYIDMLKEKPYDYERVNLPHDAKAETFSTLKSALEQFIEAFSGTEVQINLVPKLSIEDGIEASRQLLRHSSFDAERCYYGIECLRVYRKKWDEINQCFMKTPLHDYSSDAADSFRYAAIMAKKKFLPAPTPHGSITDNQTQFHDYSLNDLFTANEKSKKRGSTSSRRV